MVVTRRSSQSEPGGVKAAIKTSKGRGHSRSRKKHSKLPLKSQKNLTPVPEEVDSNDENDAGVSFRMNTNQDGDLKAPSKQNKTNKKLPSGGLHEIFSNSRKEELSMRMSSKVVDSVMVSTRDKLFQALTGQPSRMSSYSSHSQRGKARQEEKNLPRKSLIESTELAANSAQETSVQALSSIPVIPKKHSRNALATTTKTAADCITGRSDRDSLFQSLTGKPSRISQREKQLKKRESSKRNVEIECVNEKKPKLSGSEKDQINPFNQFDNDGASSLMHETGSNMTADVDVRLLSAKQTQNNNSHTSNKAKAIATKAIVEHCFEKDTQKEVENFQKNVQSNDDGLIVVDATSSNNECIGQDSKALSLVEEEHNDEGNQQGIAFHKEVDDEQNEEDITVEVAQSHDSHTSKINMLMNVECIETDHRNSAVMLAESKDKGCNEEDEEEDEFEEGDSDLSQGELSDEDSDRDSDSCDEEVSSVVQLHHLHKSSYNSSIAFNTESFSLMRKENSSSTASSTSSEQVNLQLKLDYADKLQQQLQEEMLNLANLQIGLNEIRQSRKK